MRVIAEAECWLIGHHIHATNHIQVGMVFINTCSTAKSRQEGAEQDSIRIV
jgi:hypothetical protein